MVYTISLHTFVDQSIRMKLHQKLHSLNVKDRVYSVFLLRKNTIVMLLNFCFILSMRAHSVLKDWIWSLNYSSNASLQNSLLMLRIKHLLPSSLIHLTILFKSSLKFSFILMPNENWRDYITSILQPLPITPNNGVSWFPYILIPYIAAFLHLYLHLHCKYFPSGTITLLLFAPCLKQQASRL